VRDISIIDCRFDGVTEPSIIRFTEDLALKRVLVNGLPTSSLS